MSLRKKTILLLIGMLSGLFFALYISANHFFLQSYRSVERQRAIDEAQRTADTIGNELELLGVSATDWACWDDIYNYVRGQNPGFVAANLDEMALDHLKIDKLICLDNSERPLFAYQQRTDNKTSQTMSASDALALWQKCKPNVKDHTTYGVIYMHDSAILTVSSPIKRSSGTGAAEGTLLMAKYMDRTKLLQLSDLLRLRVSISPLDFSLESQGQSESSLQESAQPPWSEEISADEIAGYAVLNNPQNRPEAIVKTISDRTIYMRGRKTIYSFLIALLVSGTLLGSGILLLLNSGLLKKLKRLDQDLQEIGASPATASKVFVDPKSGQADELTRVALTLNATLASLEAARQNFTLAFELNPNIMAITSAEDDTYLEINRAFVDKTGYNKEEVLGRTPAELSIYQDPGLRKDIAAYVREHGNIEDCEIVMKTRTGCLLTGLFSAQIMVANGRKQILSVLADITDLKQIQEELRQAQQEASAANAAKSMFLANVSHDIRTPLNGIIGSAALLEQTSVEARQRRYCTTISHSGEILLDLINDLLDFSKIESGKLELAKSEFDLIDTVEDLLATFAQGAHDKNLELVCRFSGNFPRNVIGDQIRLRQIIMNLVGNALKFTSQGQIVLSCQNCTSKSESSAYNLRFSVKDSGIGIGGDKLHRLFKSFSQADASTARSHGGTGLGLAICKRLVELMQGEIWLEKSSGSGSEFVFTVALEKAEDTETIEGNGFGRLLERFCALIIDHNEQSRHATSELLAYWGIEAESFEEPAQLPDTFQEPYNVVIVNIPPAEDIAQALQAIVQSPQLAPSPVVLLTSSTQQVAWPLDQPEQPSLVRSLSKPLRVEELLGTLLEIKGVIQKPVAHVKPYSSVSKSYQGAKILIAEDNEVNQMVLQDMLELVGVEYTAVMDGLDATKAVQRHDYDLVLMDCQLPKVDGYQAVRMIRSWEQQNNRVRMPIVALTANAFAEDRERCFAAGMDDFLTKPITPAVLYSALGKWFSADCTALIFSSNPLAPTSALPVDWEALLSRCGQKRDLAIRLLDKFFRSAQEDIVSLDILIKQQNLAEAAGLAHKLKGSAATVSVERVRQGADQLEQAAKQINLPEAVKCVEQVKGDLLSARAFVMGNLEAA